MFVIQSVAFFAWYIFLILTTFPHTSILSLICCFRRPNKELKKLAKFDKLLLLADGYLKKGDRETAIGCYKKALELVPESENLRLDLIETLLTGEYFFEAARESQKAIESGINREKVLLMLGKAEYGMFNWEKAAKCFKEILVSSPDCSIAVEEHARSNQRLIESRTGIYDWKQLRDPKNLSVSKWGPCDVGNYIGPIEVVWIPGKGKGTILTKDVEKGELIINQRAYVMVFNDDSLKSLVDKTMDKLKKNPHTAKDFFSLYAGDKYKRDGMPENGPIDRDRVEAICRLNNFGINQNDWKWKAVWTSISFFNHSCVPNCYNHVNGDMMSIYLLADLKKGDELSINYYKQFSDYTERSTAILGSWKFECRCNLCLLDSTDTYIGRRTELLKEAENAEDRLTANDIEKLLNQMRETYVTRKEYRVDLFNMLKLVMKWYISNGDYERAVEYADEASATLEAPCKYYYEAPHVALEKCINELKPEVAKKVAEINFEYRKIRVGSTKEMFITDYPELAHYLE